MQSSVSDALESQPHRGWKERNGFDTSVNCKSTKKYLLPVSYRYFKSEFQCYLFAFALNLESFKIDDRPSPRQLPRKVTSTA